MFGTDHDDPVPRQPYQLGLAGVDCLRLPVADALTSSIHYYWTLAIPDGHIRLPVIPDNAVDLVLCPRMPDYAELYFPVDTPFEIPLDGPVRYVGASLRADRLERVLGAGAASLRRLAPGIETREALGLGPLIKDLGEGAAEPAKLSARLDAFFAPRASTGDELADAPSLLERLHAAPEAERIADTARRAGLSERQFRRETRRLFGLGPKKLQRVTRLQRALAELIDGGAPRADYHDDAHRIRELRALTGWTPGEIRRMAERYNTARALPARIVSPDRTPE